ncbi:MAG TPA: hypothetical protein VIV60_16295, partial [Polyangiaceae bacterium]
MTVLPSTLCASLVAGFGIALVVGNVHAATPSPTATPTYGTPANTVPYGSPANTPVPYGDPSPASPYGEPSPPSQSSVAPSRDTSAVPAQSAAGNVSVKLEAALSSPPHVVERASGSALWL